MLKAALLFSVVCTAFAVGGPSSALSQEKPVKVAKPIYLHEALKPHVGKNCHASLTANGKWFVSFTKHFAKSRSYKLDMLGADFIRITNKESKTYIPFSSIREINTN